MITLAQRCLGRPARAPRQRGVVAIEVAFVFPLFVAFILGIFYFSLAFMGRQLLSNMAADTVRGCVARSYAGENAVFNCANTLGNYLANRMPAACIQGRIVIQPTTFAANSPGMADTLVYPTTERILKVTATCVWNLPTGSGVLGSGNPLSFPDHYSGIAAMPYTLVEGG